MLPASAESFIHATDLTFPEHIHGFISLQSSSHSFERKEIHLKPDEPFYEAMALLNEVVEVFALS